MEHSPLIKVCFHLGQFFLAADDCSQAQSHARNAANAPTPALAATEHEQAAGQFAAAAKTTGNLEVESCTHTEQSQVSHLAGFTYLGTSGAKP